jgi:hypothetical protein
MQGRFGQQQHCKGKRSPNERVIRTVIASPRITESELRSQFGQLKHSQQLQSGALVFLPQFFFFKLYW